MRNLGKDNDLKQAAAEHVRWSGRGSDLGPSQLGVKEEYIKAAIKEILEAEGKIDVLSEREFLKPNLHVSISSTLSWRTAITSTVNNAGLGFPEALEQASLQEIREIFETNFFGPVRPHFFRVPYSIRIRIYFRTNPRCNPTHSSLHS
ncbi:hypothetical protein BC936DRAFT_144650 [Jimgerdemannia flammicorona]|uniref:Uncharacterized protein n=1 Tax=Jimgerdemannia flammicorona TaxID=994334 RepID=A0A433DC11_9FUNG|nr:hypothetical protein BC936DRAFT_144650 [Jimgerdemannia flammicorona]